MNNSRRVYSSEDGRIRPPAPPRSPAPTGPPAPNDGVVRIFRDRSGRNGKVVTVIRGLPGREVEGLVAALKRLCGAGGAIKDGAVEIQGDHRERIAERLASARPHGQAGGWLARKQLLAPEIVEGEEDALEVAPPDRRGQPGGVLEHRDPELADHREPIVVAEGIETVTPNAGIDQRLVVAAQQGISSRCRRSGYQCTAIM